MRLMDVYTRTVLPVILPTHYSTVITAYFATAVEYQLHTSFLWQTFPVTLFVLQRGRSLLALFPRSIQHSRLHNVTHDLDAIRQALIPLCLFSAIIWQPVFWLDESPTIDFFVPVVVTQSLGFKQLLAATLKLAPVLFALWNTVWVALLFGDMRSTGHVRHTWLALAFAVVVQNTLGKTARCWALQALP
ncbi:hypothetical protein F5B18DRAFT_653097 [Nemania serpens]|nr:hypothetical protein F5B18DRAFT_653097 [Nemania serpens]